MIGSGSHRGGPDLIRGRRGALPGSRRRRPARWHGGSMPRRHGPS